jgi:magnesium and cobalt transporter
MEVNARISIEKLERLLNINIADDESDFDTLGGLLLSMTGYVPLKGEKIEHSSGITFQILESDPRRLKKVLICKNDLQEKEKCA